MFVQAFAVFVRQELPWKFAQPFCIECELPRVRDLIYPTKEVRVNFFGYFDRYTDISSPRKRIFSLNVFRVLIKVALFVL